MELDNQNINEVTIEITEPVVDPIVIEAVYPRGPRGFKGEDGFSILSGNGVPSDALGDNGDSYLNTDNGDTYLKSGGVWAVNGNIRGATGEQGFNGWQQETEIEIVQVSGVDKAVKKLVGYFGGTGEEPTDNVGKYEGVGGWVDTPAEAFDYINEVSEVALATKASIEYVNAGDQTNANAIVAETNARIAQGENLQDNIDAIAGGVLNIIPSSSPTVNVFTYNASEAGTYTNFGGVVIEESDLVGKVAQIRFINGVWAKYVTAIADLANYVVKTELNTEADNIFDRVEVDKFTPTLPVRRYTAEGVFNDYANGYSQTETVDGLLVQIPYAANQAIGYYLDTLKVLTENRTVYSIKINALSASTTASVGVGYISSIGEYRGYTLSVTGNVVRSINHAGTILTNVGISLLVGDVLDFELHNGVLKIYRNSTLLYTLDYDNTEYIGKILIVERGNINYSFLSNVFETPIKDYVIEQSGLITDEKLLDYPSNDQLNEKSDDLFKNVDDNIFPLHNLPVRRYTSNTVFNDYAAGYSQTATSEGLSVAIPASGSTAIAHFLNTLLPVPNVDDFVIDIDVTTVPVVPSGVGIGYINTSGDYVGLMFMNTGDFRKVVNYSIAFQTDPLSPFTTPINLKFRIKNGFLTIFKDDQNIYTYNLIEEGFQGDVLISQKGFMQYVFKTTSTNDPIRTYVDQKTISSNPICFYSYDPSGTPPGESGMPSNGLFKVYTRIADTNKYVGYRLGHEVDMRPLIYKDYWRIVDAEWYEFDGTDMIAIGKNAITEGESECVYKRNSSKDDFTGGVHGDELVTNVKFFAGGILVDEPTEAVGLTACTEFSYLEKSTMHATAESGIIITGHPTECDHIKHTTFNNSGYTTFNRLTWVMAGLVTLWYHGICCFAKDNGTTIYCTSDFTDIDMTGSGLGLPEITGYRDVFYRNDDDLLGGFITSRLIKPEVKDLTSVLFVSDRPEDSKYYRRSPSETVAIGDVWESEMIVKHTSLD